MNTIKMVMHAKNGVVGIARFTSTGVKTTLPDTIFETGSSVASFGNVVNALANVLESLAGRDDKVEIATIGIVADKINSGMLIKESWTGKPLGEKRGAYVPEEVNAINRLLKAIGQTYGKVSIRSEQYITKSIERAKTQEQADWAKLFEAVTESMVESKKSASVPTAKHVEMEVASFEDELELEA